MAEYVKDSNNEELFRSEITLELWQELYEAAAQLKSLEPWKWFSEVDLAEIYLRGRDEPYYCSIQGMFDDKYGFDVYRGYDGLVSFSAYINSLDLPEYVSKNKRNCLSCTWGERARLKNRDLKLIKNLNLKYRGSSEWPLFRDIKAGYVPWFLDVQDTAEFISVMYEFIRVFSELVSKYDVDDINEGERIYTRYDEEDDCWYNEIVAPLNEIEAVTDGCVITDELLLRRLKLKRYNGAVLEFDMPYLPVSVKEGNPEKRPFYPRIVLLCDAYTLEDIDRCFMDIRENPGDTILNILIDYIEENGRPEEIYIRDADMFGIIGHLCRETDISVHMTNSLRAVDVFIQELVMTMK